MLNPGSLNRKITIQVPAVTQDAFTEPQQNWTDVGTVWAAIHTATGKEVYAASGFTSQMTHSITIRYPAFAVQTNMRVLYGTRSFLIQGVSDPDESRVQVDLFCLETNGGS